MNAPIAARPERELALGAYPGPKNRIEKYSGTGKSVRPATVAGRESSWRNDIGFPPVFSPNSITIRWPCNGAGWSFKFRQSCGIRARSIYPSPQRQQGCMAFAGTLTALGGRPCSRCGLGLACRGPAGGRNKSRCRRSRLIRCADFRWSCEAFAWPVPACTPAPFRPSLRLRRGVSRDRSALSRIRCIPRRGSARDRRSSHARSAR